MRTAGLNTKHFALLLAAMGALACGCAKQPDPTKEPVTPPATSAKPPATHEGIGGGIAPMGGVGAGPMTPVAGSDSVQGAGSGVGSAIKEKAKEAAKKASQGGLGEEGQ